jgi:uncharacterized protein YbjT (DUF2867 family)
VATIRTKFLITGAAGNLGSRPAGALLAGPHRLRLMTHRRPVPAALAEHRQVEVCRADLEDPATLAPACADVDCLVHFAGVMFAPRPEKFLPTTNVVYVQNPVDFIKIGMASCVADTSRMKRELLSRPVFPTLGDGLGLL